MYKLDSEYILNTEVIVIAITSLISLAGFSIIIWEINFSFLGAEQDRRSYDRSIFAFSVSGVLFNLSQVIFLLELLDLGENSKTSSQVFLDVCRALYCLLIYSSVLVLLKLRVWPSVHADRYLYCSIALPTVAVISVSLCRTFLLVTDSTVNSALHLATSTLLLIVLNILPILATVFFGLKVGRVVTERFTIVSSRLLAIFLVIHLLTSCIYNILYNFVLCDQWNCADSMDNTELSPMFKDVTEEEATFRPPYLTTTPASTRTTSSSSPSTTTVSQPLTPQLPSSLQIAVVVAEIGSQVVLPLLPWSYLYSVYRILQETPPVAASQTGGETNIIDI